MSDTTKDTAMRKLSFLGFGTSSDGNTNPDEVKLDAEMDKVFAGSNREKDKFDVTQLSDLNDKNRDRQPPKYKVDEYNAHHRDAYPQKHHKGSSLKSSKSPTRSESGKTTSPSTSTANGSPVSSPPLTKKRPNNGTEDEPLISERAGHSEPHSDSSADARRIQFDKKKGPKRAEIINIPEDDSYEDDNEDQRRRKSRHQHYKNRKYSLEDNRGYRRHSGTDSASSGQRRVSVQPEDTTLEEADIDELISHRSDDPRGMRRNKVSPNDRQPRKTSQTTTSSSKSPGKKLYDRKPHKIFVQLDELQGTGDDREWKETARWIKYEEDVEEGSARWGRPHVASLSFHSLLNVRRCLETGVILLDLEERDLPGVAYRVVEQMVREDLIQEDDKPILMRALLLRHRHVNESSGGFHFGSKRKFSSYTSLQNLADAKPKIVPSSEINGYGGEARIDMKEETYSSSQEDLKRVHNDPILKRIPEGAEATTVLVGAVDFLKQPTIAFVRLAEGIPIPGITEVPIPVRFIFILMGPKTVELDYHEVGRSIATLMSNEHFHQIAYKADDRRDLLSAINEFLDESIVLPPGNWQRTDLLPFDDLKARNEWIRTRKDNAMKEKNKDKQAISNEEKKLLEASGGGVGGFSSDDDGGGGGGKKPPVGPMEKTGRLWGGLINDLKRRLPMYKSDIKDGLNTETLAATLFMYFAALSTAITFGGLSSAKTHNEIGISETLLAASMVGMIFHLIAGQPLVIIGTTGPLLLFDEALYVSCKQYGFNFLTTRVYVGMWIGIIALVVSAFEGSVYVRLFTRFTQEIFSALITLIYIVETVLKLISIYQRHPLHATYEYLPDSEQFSSSVAEALTGTTALPTLPDDTLSTLTTAAAVTTSTTVSTIMTTLMDVSNSTFSAILNGTLVDAANPNLRPSSDKAGPLNQPNTALFCTLLTLATFTVAYYLKLFRNSHFLGRNARRALGDFGVPISIAMFVFLDYMIPQVFTDKLSVPEGISPSLPEFRGWLIPMGGVPMWLPFAAGIPAILVYILAFMETHISELIVDKPERGLKKGSGLHFDIVLLSILNVVCGILGMPWHCAATVRSVTHVSAVTIMSKTHAPGDKPHIVDVKEQRISGFVVSLLVGLSVAMAPLLRLIPMSVLFGVFLYMGIASMLGVQFFDRLRLFFMPVKYHPQEPYVRRVPTWKMHLFTTVQVLSLATLWAVKSSDFSLAFPFVLVLMVPLRQKMAGLFTVQELEALDGSPPKVEPDDEPDFYEQAPIPA